MNSNALTKQTMWNKVTLPRLSINDGALESLKWIALILMTGDHVNKYLFNGTNVFLFDAGRIAMPLFVFVLAYNLARPDAFKRGVHGRTIKRLALFGLLATPAFIGLGGLMSGWWPLNILFTLLVLTYILFLVEQRKFGADASAVIVFLVAGSLVEFWWPALLFGVAVWLYCKQPSWISLALALMALAALWFINKNLWALAALPVILMSSRINFQIPRLRWVFYFYYPAHLMAIWLIRIFMSRAGYLFF